MTKRFSDAKIQRGVDAKHLSEGMKARGQEGSTSRKYKVESGKLNENFQFSIFNFQLKRAAFTLAEVLITLAVIGVVAAMTLPVLIQKQQKMAWTNQLKTNYSILNQGFTKMMADEGVESFIDTTLYEQIRGDRLVMYDCYRDTHTDVTDDEFTCKYAYNNFKKYFNYTNVINSSDLPLQKSIDGSDYENTPSGNSTYVLPNGAMFYFITPLAPYDYNQQICNEVQKAGGRLCATIADIVLDTNGEKGPNTWGRDIFRLTLTDKGAVVPYGGKDLALRELGPAIHDLSNSGELEFAIDDVIRMLTIDREGGCESKAEVKGIFERPYSCAAYLIEYKNWNMDY